MAGVMNGEVLQKFHSSKINYEMELLTASSECKQERTNLEEHERTYKLILKANNAFILKMKKY